MMDKVLYLLILSSVHILITTASLSFTCAPDVYPVSHLGDLLVTFNARIDGSIDLIHYVYNSHSLIWTYHSDFDPDEYFSYLVVNAEDPVANSSSHQFTITMNRCAGEENHDVMIDAIIVDLNTHFHYGTANVTIDEVPGTLSMTINGQVVPCGDEVLVQNELTAIGCTITEAYPEPGRLTLLHNGYNISLFNERLLNNGKCLYTLTTTSEAHITDGHNHNITCIRGSQMCSIALERACDVGAYGVNCTEVCSSHCGACHRKIGCSGGCTDGYIGEFCTIAPEGNIEGSDVCDDGGSPAWMIVAIILMVVGIFAAAATVLWIYYYKKKIQASTTPVDHKITGKEVVKMDDVYTYIEVDRTKNVAYTVPTSDNKEVCKTPTITEVKSDYKANDPRNKADDNNNRKHQSAPAICDQNVPLAYENVEFDGSNNENDTYMTPISESTTD